MSGKIKLEVLTSEGINTKQPFVLVVDEGKSFVVFTEFRLHKNDNGRVFLHLYTDRKAKNQVALFCGIGEDYALTVFGSEYTGICECCGGDLFEDD